MELLSIYEQNNFDYCEEFRMNYMEETLLNNATMHLDKAGHILNGMPDTHFAGKEFIELSSDIKCYLDKQKKLQIELENALKQKEKNWSQNIRLMFACFLSGLFALFICLGIYDKDSSWFCIAIFILPLIYLFIVIMTQND